MSTTKSNDSMLFVDASVSVSDERAVVLVFALSELYVKAADAQNYKLCDKYRQQIVGASLGRLPMIVVEQGIGFPKLFD